MSEAGLTHREYRSLSREWESRAKILRATQGYVRLGYYPGSQRIASDTGYSRWYVEKQIGLLTRAGIIDIPGRLKRTSGPIREKRVRISPDHDEMVKRVRAAERRLFGPLTVRARTARHAAPVPG